MFSLNTSTRIRIHPALLAKNALPEEAQQGMELAHSKDDGAIKVVLSFDSNV